MAAAATAFAYSDTLYNNELNSGNITATPENYAVRARASADAFRDNVVHFQNIPNAGSDKPSDKNYNEQRETVRSALDGTEFTVYFYYFVATKDGAELIMDRKRQALAALQRMVDLHTDWLPTSIHFYLHDGSGWVRNAATVAYFCQWQDNLNNTTIESAVVFLGPPTYQLDTRNVFGHNECRGGLALGKPRGVYHQYSELGQDAQDKMERLMLASTIHELSHIVHQKMEPRKFQTVALHRRNNREAVIGARCVSHYATKKDGPGGLNEFVAEVLTGQMLGMPLPFTDEEFTALCLETGVTRLLPALRPAQIEWPYNSALHQSEDQ